MSRKASSIEPGSTAGTSSSSTRNSWSLTSSTSPVGIGSTSTSGQLRRASCRLVPARTPAARAG
ncbi:hypothetical protein SAMN04489747_1022 [Auraticoccus monumenti]|uniref:Uncharacterized protein n=1 Tax=Auraticoccus monumenti TaxID=675864 RepID=A0A1G6V1L3_9ACTN|nr:hypothetical protein SAMN04489747_1022 [Auraticoccus monumenti]